MGESACLTQLYTGHFNFITGMIMWPHFFEMISAHCSACHSFYASIIYQSYLFDIFLNEYLYPYRFLDQFWRMLRTPYIQYNNRIGGFLPVIGYSLADKLTYRNTDISIGAYILSGWDFYSCVFWMQTWTRRTRYLCVSWWPRMATIRTRSCSSTHKVCTYS